MPPPRSSDTSGDAARVEGDRSPRTDIDAEVQGAGREDEVAGVFTVVVGRLAAEAAGGAVAGAAAGFGVPERQRRSLLHEDRAAQAGATAAEHAEAVTGTQATLAGVAPQAAGTIGEVLVALTAGSTRTGPAAAAAETAVATVAAVAAWRAAAEGALRLAGCALLPGGAAAAAAEAGEPGEAPEVAVLEDVIAHLELVAVFAVAAFTRLVAGHHLAGGPQTTEDEPVVGGRAAKGPGEFEVLAELDALVPRIVELGQPGLHRRSLPRGPAAATDRPGVDDVDVLQHQPAARHQHRPAVARRPATAAAVRRGPPAVLAAVEAVAEGQVPEDRIVAEGGVHFEDSAIAVGGEGRPAALDRDAAGDVQGKEHRDRPAAQAFRELDRVAIEGLTEHRPQGALTKPGIGHRPRRLPEGPTRPAEGGGAQRHRQQRPSRGPTQGPPFGLPQARAPGLGSGRKAGGGDLSHVVFGVRRACRGSGEGPVGTGIATLPRVRIGRIVRVRFAGRLSHRFARSRRGGWASERAEPALRVGR